MIKIKYGKTIWWSNIRSKSTRKDLRWRHDALISLDRHYCREAKVYLYRFTFFKFTIGWMKD